MPKRNPKMVKASAEEMDYDLPDEVDVANMRLVGRGRAAVEKLARRPDPAKTLRRAAVVLAMLAIAIFGLIYSAHMLWTSK